MTTVHNNFDSQDGLYGECDCGEQYVLGADDHCGECGSCFDCCDSKEDHR